MKFKKYILVLFPSLFMAILSLLSYKSTTMNIPILSLFIFFPALFLIQGILCAIMKVDLLISTSVSTLTFGIISKNILEGTFYIYFGKYILIEFFAYLMIKFFLNLTSKPNNINT